MYVAKNNNEAGFSIDKKWMLCMVASFVWCILLTMHLDYTDGGALTFWGFGSSAKNIPTTLSDHATSTLVAAAAPGSASDYSNNSDGIFVPEIETHQAINNNDDGTTSEEDQQTTAELQILQSSKSSGQGGEIPQGITEDYRSNSSNDNTFSGFTVAEILLLPSNYSNQSGVKITEEVRKEDSNSNNSTDEVTITTAESAPPPSSSNNQSNIIITEEVRKEDSSSSNSTDEVTITTAESAPPPSSSSNQSNIIITEEVRKEDSSSSNSTDEVTITTAESAPPPSSSNNQSNIIITEEKEVIKKEEICNMFEGVWVHDDRPVYYVEQCPFLSGQVSCRRNGRPDSDYENWIWEAKGCQIPRFNGTDMLERLRGKRMIIVGDSLNRNQWESLACLLYSSIKNPSRRAYVDAKSNLYKVFKSMDHGCSVEFYWNPFLVKLDTNQDGRKVLKLDKVAESAKRWKGADIMVFNTGHWWVHRGKMQAWDLFQYKGRQVDIEVESALELALKTWSMWLHRNVDRSKTTVFFRSISPEHKGKFQCDNTTELIRDESYRFDFPRKTLNVVEKRIRKVGSKVNYLNITKLSSYRQDGHPSVYARKDGIKPEHRLPTYSDCSHWCLPGLPDTWNRLVYAHMVLNNKSSDISP